MYFVLVELLNYIFKELHKYYIECVNMYNMYIFFVTAE